MKIYIYLIISVLCIVSCTDSKKNAQNNPTELNKNSLDSTSAGLSLLKKHCYICHSPESSSHDEIIAPPMAAVKMRYQMSYASQQEFVDAIVSWTMDPNQENALMKGAVDQFKVMPKQAFDKNEMEELALYMFQNSLDEPVWFASHQKEMHGKRGKRRQGIPK